MSARFLSWVGRSPVRFTFAGQAISSPLVPSWALALFAFPAGALVMAALAVLLWRAMRMARHLAAPTAPDPHPRPQAPQSTKSRHDNAAFLQDLDTVLARRYPDPECSPATLASTLRVSRRHLERCTAACCGGTPGQVLRAYRVQRGAEFLRRGLAVQDAAYKSGFKAREHFARSFRKQLGITPSDYQRRCKARTDKVSEKAFLNVTQNDMPACPKTRRCD